MPVRECTHSRAEYGSTLQLFDEESSHPAQLQLALGLAHFVKGAASSDSWERLQDEKAAYKGGRAFPSL